MLSCRLVMMAILSQHWSFRFLPYGALRSSGKRARQTCELWLRMTALIVRLSVCCWRSSGARRRVRERCPSMPSVWRSSRKFQSITLISLATLPGNESLQINFLFVSNVYFQTSIRRNLQLTFKEFDFWCEFLKWIPKKSISSSNL